MTDSNGDLVEKVAQAMYPGYRDDTALVETLAKDAARKAIAAVLDDLAEPTSDMVEAARYSFWVGVPDDISDTDAAKMGLQAAIDIKRKELAL